MWFLIIGWGFLAFRPQWSNLLWASLFGLALQSLGLVWLIYVGLRNSILEEALVRFAWVAVFAVVGAGIVKLREKPQAS